MRRAGIAADADALELKHAATLNVETIGKTARPSSVQQNVPAWLIFGMFFVVMPISSLFVVERREGTLARLVSLRVPFSMLLLGKVGPYFVVNLAQAALMLLAGRTLVPWFGGETLALPGRWDLLAGVTACTSFAAIGWGLLVAVCSRTLEQATVIGGVGNILAAAVGGVMVPRFVMPEAMQKVSEVSPMAWALDGFHAVILRQGGAADIAGPCVKLPALASALGPDLEAAVERLAGAPAAPARNTKAGGAWPYFAIPVSGGDWRKRAELIARSVAEDLRRKAAIAPARWADLPCIVGSSSFSVGAWDEGGWEALEPSFEFSRRLARGFGVQGPVTAVSTTCTSGLSALDIALGLVAEGEFRDALVLGAEFSNRLTVAGLARLELLSATAARP